MSKSRVIFAGRYVWVAWYPTRGRKCHFWSRGRGTRPGTGWHRSTALGPLYLGIGPGVPLP